MSLATANETARAAPRRLRHLLASTLLAGLVQAPAAAFADPTLTLTSPAASGAIVNAAGVTLRGVVTTAPDKVKSLTVQIGSNAATLRTIEVNAVSGVFATRIFAEDMTVNQPVQATFTLTRVTGEVEIDSFTFTPMANVAANGVELAMTRLSFGWTAPLQQQVASMGFANWVKAQLDPDNMVPESKIGHEPWLTYQNNLQTGANRGPGFYLDNSTFLQNTLQNRAFVAAYTDQQLREKLALFWSNHFWTATKDVLGASSTFKYEENIKYRQAALGSFRELLRVSSENSYMMAFLDNFRNTATGHNENYAREVMELHTVGVNGGYSSTDVTAVARVFTGWTYKLAANPYFPTVYNDSTVTGEQVNATPDSVFVFDPSLHDTGDKTIPFLNTTIKGKSGAAGQDEGEQLLDLLASHPSTKNFICGKLVQLLVADTPPDHFVQACVTAWGSDGIVANLVQAILLDPAYLSSVQVGAKVKTPFEYTVGLMRNFAIGPQWANPFQTMINVSSVIPSNAGMNMLSFNLPTGFGEDAASWLAQSALVNQMNGAELLLQGQNFDTFDFGNLPGISHTVQTDPTKPPVTVYDASTAEDAALGLLAYVANDRYSRPEYDAVVASLRSPTGNFTNPKNLTQRIRAALRLVVAMPSYFVK